jgi:hypothetical protein
LHVIIVVREEGRLKPDYWLKFEVPEVPAVGSYISIRRQDKREPLGEDLVVRKVWWRLTHPETEPFAGKPKVGSLTEIFVECDVAVGPYSSTDWRTKVEAARARGIEIEEFQLDRRVFPLPNVDGHERE